MHEKSEVEPWAGKQTWFDHPDLYRRLLETLAEGVSLASDDGILVYCNPAQEAMFGYGPGELLGRHVSILNAHPAEDNHRFLEDVTGELRRSGSWKGEWLNRRQDGTRFFTKAHITLVEIEGRSHWLTIQDDITTDKAAADSVRESEARLEIAAEAADLGIWDWDLTTDAFVYSDRAKSICGFSQDGAVSFEDVVRVTHPDDYPLTSEQARRALDPAVRDSEPYQYRVVRPDGEVRWVIAHGRAVFEEIDGQAKAVRYVGTLQDVTERHAIENALRESEARFRAMADSAPSPAWVTDQGGKIIFVNQAFSEVAGRTPDALLGDAWVQMLHPDDLPHIAADRAEAWKNGHAPYVWEARMANADGAWRWMRAASKPRFDADGVFQGYVGMATDVTDARRAESDLRASERRLRLAIEASNTADWSWDAGSDQIHLSPGAASLLGLAEHGRWRDLRNSMDTKNAEALAATLDVARQHRGNWELELPIRRASDGQNLWISVRGQATFTEAGALEGMIGLIADISERKKREETEKLLIREVDHRAKNVLAVAQALARLTPFISKEQYLCDFLGRVSVLGRVHALLSKSGWAQVDLAQLVRDELDQRREDEPSRIDISGPAVALSPGAAQPLSMILHELATNAIKYGALKTSGGRLAISWRQPAHGIVVLEWREFGAADAISSSDAGFGATLIDSAVRQLGGTIERTWSQTGLCCRIEFANTTEPAALPDKHNAGQATHTPQRATRVLLVEDEPLIAMDIQKMIEQAGCSVVGPAHTLEDALRLALNAEFDCALLDANLGGRHIAPVLDVLGNRVVPFALVTGYHDPGVDAIVLQKPVTPERVVAVIAALTVPVH